MAIDTTEKRASLIGYGMPFRLMLPVADGSIDQGDRQHLVGLYAGILAGGPAATVALIRLVSERVSSAIIRGERVTIATIGAESVIP